MGSVKHMIEDLKNGHAQLIECGVCGNGTFVGVAQAFLSDGTPYPLGECAQCHEELRRLDCEEDVNLMMEFRGEHWDKWVLFCLEHDRKPCVE